MSPHRVPCRAVPYFDEPSRDGGDWSSVRLLSTSSVLACVRELTGSLSEAINGRDGTRGERKFGCYCIRVV